MSNLANKPEWRFYLSCDVDLQVKVKVNALHGHLPYAQQACDQLGHFHPTAAFVLGQLSAGGEVLGLATQTTYAETVQEGCMWAEWLTFCVKYRDLPADTFLSLSVYELVEGRPMLLVGSTAMPLFSKKGRLKTGQQRLQVWEGCALDVQQPERLMGKPPLHQRSQVGHLEHLVKLYSRGDIPHCDWLDILTLKEVHQLRAAELQEAVAQGVLLLTLELPVFPHAVLYQQSLSAAAVVAQAAGAPGGVAAAAAGASLGAAGAAGSAAGVADIIRFQDPEVGLDNPAELKAAKLARSVTRGLIDKDLKPNSDERRRINAVLQLPPNKPLSQEAKALLWRFRYALVKEKRALTKFLKCVDWSDAQEAQQAAELMKEWAAIDIADALELLSPDFKNHEVRAHAVATLQRKEDDELLYYLLQLVQALRFEAQDNSRLARFLVNRATHNPAFATFLHWYLVTEFEDPEFGGRASAVHGAMLGALDGAGPPGKAVCNAIRKQTEVMSQLAYISKELKMSRLKAARATERMREMVAENGPCSELAACLVPLPLKPEVLLEGLLPQECTCFRSAQLPMKLVFRTALKPIDWHSPNPLAPSAAAAPAGAWVAPPPAGSSPTAAAAAEDAAGSAAAAAGGAGGAGGGSHHHPQQLQHQGSLNQQQQQQQRQSLSAVPGQQQQWPEQLPAPQQQRAVSTPYGRCVVIYKKGDDLRQDQFILQMISLMDNLLKRENLDLRLTPYMVLPTGSDDGLVEFVPSAPLSRILAEHRTIHKYLAQTQADATGPFGLKPEVLEAFVRSCAGSCVMTYILGVGDRHLDNLMLVPDGRLFHIDFGYILGNDPKPFPPPMKLCREMIEAMGGQDSKYYGQFRLYCCEAYEILRKSSDLILSLFHLMAGASIEAIRNNPENAMLKLQEKLCLDLDEAQARDKMQQLINESATALMPQIVETTHRWAQYWR